MVGWPRVVEVLLKRGADPKAENDEGQIPLDVAKSGVVKDILSKAS